MADERLDYLPGENPVLARVIAEVAEEAHLSVAVLRPEERAYLKDHAPGGYIAFVIGLFSGGAPRPLFTTVAALITVFLFALVQCSGAREQARLMQVMTWGAILGLVWFWLACLPGVRLDRIFTRPL